jgi:hypothetical protein
MTTETTKSTDSIAQHFLSGGTIEFPSLKDEPVRARFIRDKTTMLHYIDLCSPSKSLTRIMSHAEAESWLNSVPDAVIVQQKIL